MSRPHRPTPPRNKWTRCLFRTLIHTPHLQGRCNIYSYDRNHRNVGKGGGGERYRIASNSETASSIRVALELDQRRLDDMSPDALNFKFVNFAAEGADANKLSAKTLAIFGLVGLTLNLVGYSLFPPPGINSDIRAVGVPGNSGVSPFAMRMRLVA